MRYKMLDPFSSFERVLIRKLLADPQPVSRLDGCRFVDESAEISRWLQCDSDLALDMGHAIASFVPVPQWRRRTFRAGVRCWDDTRAVDYWDRNVW